ncbi:MFS transporter [Paraburkholderia guartelaensis]|uniref:MFS transporter n=1 Tax=Paraburkholderia guartelaensis TaxID=2546446 RepID=UPI002AB7400C|nr:MFS transporter [Paraburkholderia guartelaensis]
MSSIFNVDDLIDGQKLGWFNIRLLVYLFVVMLLDGYDIIAVGFAGPHLVKEWHVPAASLGPVFSASLIGILLGSLFFGFIGDRLGRKFALVASCVAFGILTMFATTATSVPELIGLRFLAGVGIGGVLPNAIALTSEYSPKRYRATMVILMFSGNTFGASLPGLVSVTLVPRFGWQVLFWVGGILPLAIALLLALALPESIRFLALDERRRARAIATLRRLMPHVAVPADAQLVTRLNDAGTTGTTRALRFRQLFEGRLAKVTPLLWLTFALNLMVFYFINSWTPTLAMAAGVTPGTAAFGLSMFQVGGTLGGFALCRFVDRSGLKPLSALFFLCIPVVGLAGFTVVSSTFFVAGLFVVGFCVLGLQAGLNAMAGILYPTSCRANGVGHAFGLGRIGAVVGPLAGGALIGMHVSMQTMFMLAAIPVCLGAIACFALNRTAGEIA